MFELCNSVSSFISLFQVCHLDNYRPQQLKGINRFKVVALILIFTVTRSPLVIKPSQPDTNDKELNTPFHVRSRPIKNTQFYQFTSKKIIVKLLKHLHFVLRSSVNYNLAVFRHSMCPDDSHTNLHRLTKVRLFLSALDKRGQRALNYLKTEIIESWLW